MSNVQYCSQCNCARPHYVMYDRRNFFWVCPVCNSKQFWYESPYEYTNAENMKHAKELNRILCERA